MLSLPLFTEVAHRVALLLSTTYRTKYQVQAVTVSVVIEQRYIQGNQATASIYPDHRFELHTTPLTISKFTYPPDI